MLARVIYSCSLFLLIVSGFAAMVLGFQQEGISQVRKGKKQQTDTKQPASRNRPTIGRQTRTSQYRPEIASDQYGRFLRNSKCRVQLIHDIEVPALEAGQIKSILVSVNQEIDPTHPIALLRDDAARFQKEVAEKNRNVAKVDADNLNRVSYARKSLEFAQDIFSRKEKLYKERGSINFVEYREAQYQESQAQLQLDEAFSQKKVALEKLAVEEVNIKAAEDLIKRHQVSSLLEKGEVAEIYVQVGEWVNRGDKVARVIQMDRLKISGLADAKKMFPGELMGKPVKVILKVPNRDKNSAEPETAEVFDGRVIRVKSEISFSDMFFFEVEIENRMRGKFWLLRPNAEVELRVYLDQQ